MGIKVFSFLVALLLLASTITQVVRCQSKADVDATEVVERDDLGIVGDETQVFDVWTLSLASGVDTICVFPKNAAKLVPTGEVTEILVGMHNEGESILNVLAMHGSLHLPYDHHMLVQKHTMQEFFNASVPFSAQVAFPYNFAVNKFLQPGLFDLVGTIVYEIDPQRYQSVFYNGTTEVVEARGFLSIKSIFLVTLGAALIGLFGLGAYGQVDCLILHLGPASVLVSECMGCPASILVSKHGCIDNPGRDLLGHYQDDLYSTELKSSQSGRIGGAPAIHYGMMEFVNFSLSL